MSRGQVWHGGAEIRRLLVALRCPAEWVVNCSARRHCMARTLRRPTAPRRPMHPMHPMQSTQSMHATQAMHRRQRTQAMVAMHLRMAMPKNVSRLPDTATLPAVPDAAGDGDAAGGAGTSGDGDAAGRGDAAGDGGRPSRGRAACNGDAADRPRTSGDGHTSRRAAAADRGDAVGVLVRATEPFCFRPPAEPSRFGAHGFSSVTAVAPSTRCSAGRVVSFLIVAPNSIADRLQSPPVILQRSRLNGKSQMPGTADSSSARGVRTAACHRRSVPSVPAVEGPAPSLSLRQRAFCC